MTASLMSLRVPHLAASTSARARRRMATAALVFPLALFFAFVPAALRQRRQRRAVRLASVVTGLLLLAASGARADAFDLNPDHFAAWPDGGNRAAAGRVVGIAVDPANGQHAWALAENAGVFGTTDGGQHWQGNVLPDGTPGPYGGGLAGHGLIQFAEIAVDPHNASVLLLVASDDHREVDTQQGFWRSSNGGATWTHIAAPPNCPLQYQAFSESGQDSSHVLFAPTLHGVAVVTTPCGLGTTGDDGLIWTWDATGSAPYLSGVGVVPAGGKIITDTFAFCGSEPTTGAAVGIWTLKGPPSWYPMPAGSWGGGGCSVAFSPYSNSILYLAARDGNDVARVYEGTISGSSVSWTDLHGPGHVMGSGNSFDRNGRPVIVATHRDGAGYRLYYSNSTLFSWEQCSGLCPVGSASPALDQCPLDLPWHCMAYFHPDFAAIAFDPQRPTVACPLYAVGDGGVVGETACGNSPIPADGLPRNTGLHALQSFAMSRTSDGDVVLATQDNSALRLRHGVWRSDFCGDATDSDALGQAQYVQTCDSASNPVAAAAIEESAWPWSGHPVDVGLPSGLVPGAGLRFSDPSVIAGAVVGKVTGVEYLFVAVHRISASAGWARMVPGHAIPVLGTACCGDFAIGGRAEPRGIARRFYVSLASDSNPLGRTLYCNESGHWYDAVGVPDPVAVWASPASQRWTLVWDEQTGSLYTETSTPCHFVQDLAPTRLITGNGTWADPTDPGSRRWLVSTIGFDPDRPDRAFIATRHNGILVTADHGKTWGLSHEFPEPNGGVTTLVAPDTGIGEGGPIEGVFASSWGRGLWRIHLDRPRERYLGLPQTSIAESGGHVFRVRARCAAPTACSGYLHLEAYLPASHGRLQVQSVSSVRVLRLPSGEMRTYTMHVADHIQRLLSRRLYTARITGTIPRKQGGAFTSRRTIVIQPSR
jgi:hypothetical protein